MFYIRGLESQDPLRKRLDIVNRPFVTFTIATSLLFFLLVPAVTTAQAAARTVRMAVLVLTATGDPSVEPTLASVRQTLESMDVPFDEIALTKGGKITYTGQLPLVDASGRGRYQAIVLTSGDLEFQDSSGNWASGLSTAHATQLEAYETQFGVRRVAMFAYPGSIPGLTVATTSGANGSSAAAVLLPKTEALLADPALSPSAKIELPAGCWRYGGSITNTAMAKPFLVYSTATSTVAAVVSRPSTGREHLYFLFDAGDWSMASVVLGPSWLRWVTRGEHFGARRIYLSTQVDDLYLSSDLWNPTLKKNPEDGTRVYRCTAADLAAHATAQAKVASTMAPSGSSLKTEFAFNNEGVVEAGGAASDALYAATKSLASNFFFVNHTWSHQVLNDLTYDQTLLELQQNHDFMAANGGAMVARYGKTSLITPEISGLFNPAALTAMKKVGIKYVVSDNTRPEFNFDNPYHGKYTTVSANGADGILMIPRFATEMYYDCSIPTEEVSEYNSRYYSYWGRNLTAKEIFDLEAKRAARYLLLYRHDPHMFHQSNLRLFKANQIISGRTGNTSFLSLWQEVVVKEVVKWSALPIVTLPMDQLAQTFVQRTDLDAAGATIFRSEDTTTGAVSFSVTANKTCQVPLTGVAIQKAGSVVEVYGPDKTSWITCLAGQTVTFSR